MTEEKKIHPIADLKFWLFCFCGFLSAYLVFKDPILPLNVIWNINLFFLMGSFVFGFIYKSDFLGISFWLLLGLGVTDLIKGIPSGMVGASYLGGLVVCLITFPAGLAGWGLSFFIPKTNKPVFGKNRKTS